MTNDVLSVERIANRLADLCKINLRQGRLRGETAHIDELGSLELVKGAD